MRPKYLIIIGLFLVLMAALLVACGGKSNPTIAPTSTAVICPTCPEVPKCPDPTKCPDCPPAPTQAPCPTAEPCPSCPEAQEAPFQADWAGTGPADTAALAFNDWNDTETKAVPATCARCHSTPGYLDYLGADGTEAGKVDNPAPIGTVITCQVCHNTAAIALTEVTFPSGAVITGLGP